MHRSREEITLGIQRLSKRVDELKQFDAASMLESRPPSLKALETSIERSLERTFGAGTNDFKRYASAADLSFRLTIAWSGMPPTPLSEYRDTTARKIANAVRVLTGAIADLQEELDELPEASLSPTVRVDAVDSSRRKVFIVHGHDEAAREKVARFLDRVGIEVVILHEQANRDRTIIEKIEANSDVAFAVVLLTADDEGRKTGEARLRPRVRQNVLLELGYFIGLLGRDKVCALMSGEPDVPTDFAGVVWTPIDSSDGWQMTLCRELKAADIAVDVSKLI